MDIKECKPGMRVIYFRRSTREFAKTRRIQAVILKVTKSRVFLRYSEKGVERDGYAIPENLEPWRGPTMM